MPFRPATPYRPSPNNRTLPDPGLCQEPPWPNQPHPLTPHSFANHNHAQVHSMPFRPATLHRPSQTLPDPGLCQDAQLAQ